MFNQSFFIGRLTQKPELKKSKNDKLFCKFQLAVMRSKDSHPDFPEFIGYQKSAENICRYVKKGDLIAVTAHYHSYIKNQKKYSNFIVEKIIFLNTGNFSNCDFYNDIYIPE